MNNLPKIFCPFRHNRSFARFGQLMGFCACITTGFQARTRNLAAAEVSVQDYDGEGSKKRCGSITALQRQSRICGLFYFLRNIRN
jgi:hypothetical protein